jgi:hypothetical protein
MTIGPNGFSNQSRLNTVSDQETFLSIYVARSRSKKGSSSAGSSQGQTNSDSVSLSDEALSLTVYTHCKILKVLQGRGFSVLWLNLYCICSGIIVNTNTINTLQ